MCGITGVVDLREEREVPENLLAGMNGLLSHRGPDGDGYHLEPGCGLGHRRLAIIDLEGGRQPLYNEDDSVVVVYNGEIYNFQELEKELESLGHRFRTRCDTEVIVHAWEQWGEHCVDRFRGMFAFAIWDRNQRTLFLARDRLGIKPLYYSFTAEGLCVFASELKAVLAHPSVGRSIDHRAVEDYFCYGYVPDPKTIYRDVAKLAPGFVLRLQRGRPAGAPRCYWDVTFAESRVGSLAEWREELVTRLTEAVRIRLVSEVPLGAFLSGGVDSSAVVATMSGQMSDPVTTCSISFDDKRFDESRYAAMVAERYHTNHHVESVLTDDYDLLPTLAGLYDEPYADSSAIPTYRVCEIASRRVTVALSGDGGDENLVGYRRYLWFALEERFRRRIPASLRRTLFGAAGRLYPKLDWAPKFLRAKSTLQAIAYGSVEGYFHSVAISTVAQRQRLYTDAFKRELQGYRGLEVFNEHAAGKEFKDSIALAQYLDLKTYLPGDILTKVDRASMAHSLEVRVPFLDHPLVEWMASLPTDVKLHQQERKYLLKTAFEPHLPHDVLYRRKMGFAVPLSRWLKGPLRQTVNDRVLKSGICDLGLFEPAALQKTIDEHFAGTVDHSALIWALLMFEATVCQNQPTQLQAA